MNSLAEIIRDEIKANAPLTFARFMELALYHPELGYYRRLAKPFGRDGDFYTASQLQPVFGEMVAAFAGESRVLELGAGARELSRFFAAAQYLGFDWDGDPLPKTFEGLVFANEFFDALPVHVLKRADTHWRELFVDHTPDRLVWMEGSLSSNALEQYAEHYGAHVPTGGLLEVNLDAPLWIERIARTLTSGRFLIIDYGYTVRELSRFPQGTLLAYSKHAALSDLLCDPGTRDLTAHVNFTCLEGCARVCGFDAEPLTPLSAWAMKIWDEAELTTRWKKENDRWRLLWKQIVFGLGETFRVLALKK